MVLMSAKRLSLQLILLYLLTGNINANKYYCMSLLYNFDMDSVEDLLKTIAENFQKRRLEKGLSRGTLSEISGVPPATIAKFEQKHAISLASYVALAKALGYTQEIKKLLATPQYNTMEELDRINKNKERKRGSRNETNK